MADSAKAAGIGARFVYADAEYVLPALTLQHYCMFEAWLEGEAWKGVERGVRHLSRAGYDAAMRIVSQDIAAQVYAFGSETYAKAQHSVAGVKYLFLIALRDTYPEVDEEWVDKFAEAKGLSEVVRLVNAANTA